MAGWILGKQGNLYRNFLFEDPNPAQDVIFGWLRKPQRLADRWQAPRVHYSTEEWSGLEVQPQTGGSNFPGFYGFQAWDRRAVEVLRPLVEHAVEFLPLETDVGEFYVINVVAVVDCLDHERSTLRRFAGQVVGVENYIFKEGCLDGQHIFRLAEENYARIYLSDTFKQTVEANGLVGLRFEKAWD